MLTSLSQLVELVLARCEPVRCLLDDFVQQALLLVNNLIGVLGPEFVLDRVHVLELIHEAAAVLVRPSLVLIPELGELDVPE